MKLGGEEPEDGSQILEDGGKANTWQLHFVVWSSVAIVCVMTECTVLVLNRLQANEIIWWACKFLGIDLLNWIMYQNKYSVRQSQSCMCVLAGFDSQQLYNQWLFLSTGSFLYVNTVNLSTCDQFK